MVTMDSSSTQVEHLPLKDVSHAVKQEEKADLTTEDVKTSVVFDRDQPEAEVMKHLHITL